MDKNRAEQRDFSELRRRAEARLPERRVGDYHLSGSDAELRRLIHELSVHQIELEMQNDELQLTANNLAASRQELKQSLERYKDLYDFAPVGYLTLEKSSKIVEANLTATKLLGIERKLLKQSRLSGFIADVDLPVFNALLAQVFGTSEPGNCEVRIRDIARHLPLNQQEAPEKPVRTIRIEAVTDEHATLCRVTLSDISRQQEAERENAALQANLAQAQKMDSIGRLAGGIAHDFNNMLAAILGNAELALRKTASGETMLRGLEAIVKAAKRSAELTSQLLAFARKQSVMPRILELNASIDSSVEMLQRLIGENIVVDWRPSGKQDYVWMDPVQIDQLLINLCVNARDAISGHGRIVIRTSGVQVTPSDCRHGHCCKSPGDYVRISVTDTGAGIDKETLPHIFEPFFTTKEPGQGTGLGLSTIYGIVKQNSGFLECTSEPGNGSTFAIYLPRHTKSVPAAEHLPPSEPADRSDGAILLVEDDPDILGFIRQSLESTGYAVYSVQSPTEAMNVASKCHDQIRLLLTDVVMPDMNGNELANKLDAMIPDLKIMFMSGYAAEVIAGYADQKVDVKFLQKPFSIATLVAAIEEVLNS